MSFVPARLGVALRQALDRQAVRDACDSAAEVELVVTSSTVSGLIHRHTVEALDWLVIDTTVPDADAGIRELVDAGVAPKLLVISADVAAITQTFGLRSRQVLPPSNTNTGEQIVARLRADATAQGGGPPKPSAPPTADERRTSFKRREIVVLGCSTGGPDALPVVLAAIPANFAVPIVVVQHMPANFTGMFAERLDKESPLKVRELTSPVRAKRGEVWIAPGDRHMILADSAGSLELDPGPEVKNCRPSVDVLFHSAARTYGRRVVGVILTGMGDDGCDGARSLDAEGAYLIAQDEATSVVWGMPGAMTKAGLSDAVLPLDQIASEIMKQFRTAVPVAVA